MDKLLKVLGFIAVLMYYPLWYRLVAAAFFCVGVVVVVAGVCLYSNAARIKADKDAPAKIGVNVSVMQNANPDMHNVSDTSLQYECSKNNAAMIIEPVMGYLSCLRSGGPIKPIEFEWTPFDWDFPNLDIKVVNNGAEMLVIDEAVLDVAESKTDPTPVLLIRPDAHRSNALHFKVLNEGWGPARDAKVSFHLAPYGASASPDYSEPFPNSTSIGDVDESVNVDLSSCFEKAGVDIKGLSNLTIRSTVGYTSVTVEGLDGREATYSYQDFLRKRSSLLGKFDQGGALVSGEISYKAGAIDGSLQDRRVKFSTVVWAFNEYLVGVPRPPSYQYTARLEVDGHNYQRRVDVSQEIKPGESDRFGIKIGVDKSSVHRFRLRLIWNGDKSLDTGDTQLTVFVPRTGAEFVSRQAESPKANKSGTEGPK